MENLKPCPICGNELEVVYIGGGWFWRHKIDPPYPLCPITYSRKYSTREETIREINKRADDNLVSPKKEKIEDLKSEIRKHLSQIDCDNAEIKFLRNHMEVLSEIIDKLQLEVETARSDARNEFAEKTKEIIDSLVELMFDWNARKCQISNCYKPDSIPCESEICIQENKEYWHKKIDNILEELEKKNNG